jgi:hypothetical protein
LIMKRLAFLQALVLFLLFTVSWLVLWRVLSGPDTEETPPPVPATGSSGEPAEATSPPGPDSQPGTPTSTKPEMPASPIPETWEPWLEQLQAATSPDEVRGILDALRRELFSLSPEEAVARIEAFLQSGLDARTGLAFEVGPGGRLRGAASFRAQLLDWLGQIDPARSARWARNELTTLGTGLAPDVYVIHLRNFAWGTGLPETGAGAFLRDQFGQLIRHQPWIREPSSAIAESMDVAVYTDATEFTPELSALMQPDRPRMLRHAASLALERLVDRRPAETLSLLLREAGQPTAVPKARAGYFARLDPGHPEAARILDPYLTAPGVDRGEAVRFLQSFPNLNQSLSHNLLSSNIPMTTAGEAAERLEAARNHVRRWLSDPAMEALADELAETAERIRRQLGQ